MYFLELQENKDISGNCNTDPNHELGKLLNRLCSEYKILKKGQTSLITIDQIKQLKSIVGFS